MNWAQLGPYQRRRPRPCRYGIGSIICGMPSSTKRRRPTGELWDVCDGHAATLDRVTARVAEDADLLRRIALS